MTSVSDASVSQRRLLLLGNPGRMSRWFIEGMARAAGKLGIDHVVWDLGLWWKVRSVNELGLARAVARLLRELNVGAVIGYTVNGITDLPATRLDNGRLNTFFANHGIPQIVFWGSHPHWAHERQALRPEVLPLMQSPNTHHVLKSQHAACELMQLLKWPSCSVRNPASDPDLFRPCPEVSPDFDVVSVLQQRPELDDDVQPFVSQKEPCVDEIVAVLARKLVCDLHAIWERDAPPKLAPYLRRLTRQWVERQQADLYTAAWWHLVALARENADAALWLFDHPLTYFDAEQAFWRLRNWERPFMLAYLARFFKVGVFGGDWSSVGCGGSADWVDYPEQASVYARGKIALNVLYGCEQEALTQKPFEITASGVPLLHSFSKTLPQAYSIGDEVEMFSSPAEARDKVAELIANPARREQMASAARERMQAVHTWAHWLYDALCGANLSLRDFQTGHSGQRGQVGFEVNVTAKWLTENVERAGDVLSDVDASSEHVTPATGLLEEIPA